MKENDFNYRELKACLEVVHDVCSCDKTSAIVSFFTNHLEFFGEIIKKINLNLPFQCAKLIAKIVSLILALGECQRIGKEADRNIFSEYVFEHEELVSALEYGQEYRSQEVSDAFYKLVVRYFHTH